MNSVITAFPWYVTRGSGIMALVLLILLMIGGIGHITGWTYRFIEPVRAWLIHKWMGIMLGVLILIHVGALLVDGYLPFTLADITIPFAKLYNNKSVGSDSLFAVLAIPSAIVATYLGGWILLTSLTPLKKYRRLWKVSHWLSYLIVPLLGIHVLFAGTEFKSGLVRTGLFATLILIGILFLIRTARRARLPKPDTVRQ